MKQRVLFILLYLTIFGIHAEDTVLKLYRPYGEVHEQIAPEVKKTLIGHCMTQSRLIVREDAWRCEAEGQTYDPCFVKAGANRTEAVCPQSPWVGDSVLIKVRTPLNNEENQPLDMSQAFPWGIELVNGERCLAIESDLRFEEMPVRYRCGKQNVLMGHIQRCHNTWSMLEKTPEGVATVELAKAWF